MKKNTSLPSFTSLLAFILVLTDFISAAPYPPRNRQRQPHAHNEAHPIIPNHHHDSQYRQENETTSTVVIVPIKPDQDHNEEELQHHEPHQPPHPHNEKEKAEEKVEIRTPYKLTSQIIVVQRIVDRILIGVNDTADQNSSKGISKEEAELEIEDVRNESTEDGESARTEEEAVEPREDIRVGEPSSDNYIDKEHLRRHVGYEHGMARSDRQVESVQVIWENGTVEGPEDKSSGKGDGEARGNVNERRDTSTSGPGPDDQGNERVVVLMGWTALVGVVGILAIAPAG